jgi:hypothetical protein
MSEYGKPSLDQYEIARALARTRESNATVELCTKGRIKIVLPIFNCAANTSEDEWDSRHIVLASYNGQAVEWYPSLVTDKQLSGSGYK